MATHISHSPQDTEALGAMLALAARAGDVFALRGDLGAGKTQWVRGFARGLGFAGRVHSPTFALVNIYFGGRLPIFHLDLYRLETPAQVQSAGLDEYLRPAGISVVEWAERWRELAVPPAAGEGRIFWLDFASSGSEGRSITYEHPGA